MRREGERDAMHGIIAYDGLYYDGWLPPERSTPQCA